MFLKNRWVKTNKTAAAISANFMNAFYSTMQSKQAESKNNILSLLS